MTSGVHVTLTAELPLTQTRSACGAKRDNTLVLVNYQNAVLYTVIVKICLGSSRLFQTLFKGHSGRAPEYLRDVAKPEGMIRVPLYTCPSV